MNGLSCFLYKFFSSTLLKRQFQELLVCDHDRALILEVYGLWGSGHGPDGPGPGLETNSNHSLLSLSTTFVSQVYPENLKGIQK